MSLIELSQIQRFYGSGESRVHVLDDINLSIAEGDFVAIVGSSGSGKSTLMNVLGCLDVPTSGSYRFMGRETSAISPNELAALRRQFFGFIFQRYYLLPGLSAWENVALPALYDNVPLGDRRKRAQELLSQLGLQEKVNNRPAQLSGGQQQRVSIARALMNGGKIILADEPTGALDSKSGDTVMDTLVELNQQGHTIIMVTHDMNVAKRAHRIVEIRDGQIVGDHVQKEAPIPPTPKAPAPQGSVSKKGRLVNLWGWGQMREALRMSMQSIWTNKLRSFLTMLGIIIGICAVVTVVAVGDGSQQQIMKQLASLGSNAIQVYPGTGWGDTQGAQNSALSVQDGVLLAKQPYVTAVSPLQVMQNTVVFGNQQRQADLVGTSPAYPQLRMLNVILGRYFTAQENTQQAQVAVINDQFYTSWYAKRGINPIGQVIYFQSVPLTIIGVVKQLGLSEAQDGGGNSLVVYTPYNTMITRILGPTKVMQLMVGIKPSYNINTAQQQIVQLLSLRHGRKDVFTWSADSYRQEITKITSALTLLVSSIAFIALVVGGIGVMNIMLVSVTERTQEIGIKMAVGARGRNIMQNFLVESVILCLIGGMIGVLLSVIIIWLFNAVVTQFQMVFNLDSFITAVIVSTTIGVLFGLMPARRASKMTPLQALLNNE